MPKKQHLPKTLPPRAPRGPLPIRIQLSRHQVAQLLRFDDEMMSLNARRDAVLLSLVGTVCDPAKVPGYIYTLHGQELVGTPPSGSGI